MIGHGESFILKIFKLTFIFLKNFVELLEINLSRFHFQIYKIYYQFLTIKYYYQYQNYDPYLLYILYFLIIKLILIILLDFGFSPYDFIKNYQYFILMNFIYLVHLEYIIYHLIDF
jgi:hypothetical protein